MRPVPTQFDAGRLSAAVGTPSCCGCCCSCCCCVGTVVGISAMAARNVADEGKRSGTELTPLWAVVAALHLLLALAVVSLAAVLGAVADAYVFLLAVFAAATLILGGAFAAVRRSNPFGAAAGYGGLAMGLIVLEAFVALVGFLGAPEASVVIWVLLAITIAIVPNVIYTKRRDAALADQAAAPPTPLGGPPTKPPILPAADAGGIGAGDIPSDRPGGPPLAPPPPPLAGQPRQQRPQEDA